MTFANANLQTLKQGLFDENMKYLSPFLEK